MCGRFFLIIINYTSNRKCLTSLPPLFVKQVSETAASENFALACEIRPDLLAIGLVT